MTYLPRRPLALSIVPGQRMMASLRVLDETTGAFHSSRTEPPATSSPRSTMDCAPLIRRRGSKPKVSGATAEWIVERPTDVNTFELYELPDYRRVHFTNCFAISAVMPPGGAPGSGLEQTLDGARLINMYKVERNPSRTVVISKSQRLANDRIETTYTG